MKHLHILLFLTPCLAQAVSNLYTGFNYGAFWGEEANVKTKDDFLNGFNQAKKLGTPIPFDSARLFTCKAAGTPNDPNPALDAAVETKTNLLLGFWISPPKRGDSPDENVKNEMAALEKAFNKHQQALADLIIGLSVGSEDIYRWENKEQPLESGVSADVVSATIKSVREAIAASSFAKYMQGKPIGHVDVAKHAVVEGADFQGMTAYPYWAKAGIEKAKESFHESLENVKQRAGNTPVWIAEMGWPFEGKSEGNSDASPENLQKFWTEVGCSVIGTYNTFWFELLKDSTAEQPDWGVIDSITQQPRIKDMSCPGGSGAPAAPASSSQAPPSTAPTVQPNSTSLTTLPTQNVVPAPLSPSSSPPVMGTSAPASPSTADSKSTIHVTTTIYTTIQPSPTDDEEVTITITSTLYVQPTPSSNAPAIPRSIPPDHPWCVTVADIDYNGHPVTVAGAPAGPDGKCSPPPTYNGLPYVTTGPSIKPTHVSPGTPWCVTMADIDRNNHPVAVGAGPAGADGKCSTASIYNGDPYVTVTQVSASGSPVPAKGTTSASLSNMAPAPPRSVIPVVSSSAATPPPSASASTTLASGKSTLATSSVHPFCASRSSRLASSSASGSLSAVGSLSLPSSSAATSASALPPSVSPRLVSGTLPAFSFPSETSVSKRAVTRGAGHVHGKKRRWW